MTEYSRYVVGNFTVQEQVTTGNFVIYLIELILCFFGILTNSMFLVVIYRANLLHQNLRIILFSTCLANCCFCISRYLITIPLIISHLFNVEISTVTFCWAALSSHHIFMGVPGVTFFVVIIERAIASFFYKTYEIQTSNKCGYILVAFQWSFSLFIVAINQFDVFSKPRIYPRLPCQREYSSSRCIFISIILMSVLNIIASIIFLKMVKFNRRLYKQRAWILRTLSETFQVSENVKSTKIIIPILVVMLGSNFILMIIVGLQAIIYFLLRETPEDQRDELAKQLSIKLIGRGSEVSQSIDIFSAISKILFGYIIYYHPVLRRKFCQIFLAKRVEHCQKHERKLTVREHTDYHFDSLQIQWNICEIPFSRT